jgi:hypothetical protein
MTHPSKLTLRLDSTLIEQAKEYAHQQDRSLSQIVADYFARLAVEPETTKRRGSRASQRAANLSPVTRSLLGALTQKTGLAKPASKAATAPDLDKEAYRKHLEEKYL